MSHLAMRGHQARLLLGKRDVEVVSAVRVEEFRFWFMNRVPFALGIVFRFILGYVGSLRFLDNNSLL